MSNFYTYDSKDVNFVVNNIVLTDLAEGDSIECGRNEDFFSETVGLNGDVVHNTTNNDTGFFKVKLMQTSPYCATLEQWAREGTYVPVQIIDLNSGGINASCTKGRVKKTADKSFGNKVGEREYEIAAVDYTTGG